MNYEIILKGLDNQLYWLEAKVFNNDLLLIQQKTKIRYVARNGEIIGNQATWDFLVEYKKPRFYVLGFMVLRDFELDKIKCKYDQAIEITEKDYYYLREKVDTVNLSLAQFQKIAIEYSGLASRA